MARASARRRRQRLRRAGRVAGPADAPLAGRGRRGLLVTAHRRPDRVRVLTAGRTRDSSARWTRRRAQNGGRRVTRHPTRPVPPPSAHGSGPKATPLAHEGKVFTLGVSGILAAFDGQTGTLLWRTEAPSRTALLQRRVLAPGCAGAGDRPSGKLRRADRVRCLVGRSEVEDRRGRSLHVPDAGDAAGSTASGVGDPGRGYERLAVQRRHVVGVRMARRQAGGIMPTVHGDQVVVSASGSGVMALRPALRGGAWTVEKIRETSDVVMT